MNAGPILELHGLAKHFGGLSVVENLSFVVARGSRTAMIGPNGAGKTTVFNLISGLLPAEAGRILFDGHDISAVPSRRRVGYGIARSFQNVRLMPHLTTLENVMVGQHSRCRGLLGILQPINLLPNNRWRDEARAALADAGLAHMRAQWLPACPMACRSGLKWCALLWPDRDCCCWMNQLPGLNWTESEALQQLLDRICANTAVTLLIIEHDMHLLAPCATTWWCSILVARSRKARWRKIRDDPVVQRIYLGAVDGIEGAQPCCSMRVISTCDTAGCMPCAACPCMSMKARSSRCLVPMALVSHHFCAHCSASRESQRARLFSTEPN